MATPLTIDRPFNLEADAQAATSRSGAPKLDPLSIQQPSPAQAIGLAPLSPSELMDSIWGNATKGASKANPMDSKFQSSDLTERYAGKSVQFGDYQLDQKLLDARYSKTQSYAEQSYNSLKVGLANGGSMFALGFLGIPSLIKNIKNGFQGVGAETSAAEDAVFQWSRDVADNNITFANEQDGKTDVWNTILNVVAPSAISGSSGGWGKIFENLMYGVGAGASIAVQEVAASFLLPGVGNSLVLGSNVAKILNNVNNISRYGKLANRVVESAEVINEVGTALNTSNRIRQAARWAYGSSIGAHGEAAFEGIEGREAMKKELVAKFEREKGYSPSGKDLQAIQQISNDAGSARYWANMGLLMGTNSIQLKRLYSNLDLAREATETLAQRGMKVGINKEGKVLAENAVKFTSPWWEKGGFQKAIKAPLEKVVSVATKDFTKESLSEGVEEFSQGWIDKAVNNYYTWKIDHRGQPFLDQAMKSVGDGFAESWDHEGLSAFLSGAIAGVGQQALFSLPNAHKQLELSRNRKKELDDTLNRYNTEFQAEDFARASHAENFIKAGNVNSVRGSLVSRAEGLNATGVADNIADIATEQNDRKLYKDVEALSFFTLAEPYINRGHADILKQQMKYAVDNIETDAGLQDLFGNPNITKEQALREFNQKVDKANASYSKIKQNFKNPFNAGGSAIEQAKYNTFEEKFVPQLAYLDYRIGDLVKRREDIQKDLGHYYDDLKNFAFAKDLPTRGRKQIEEELERIKGSEEYLKELGVADSQIGTEFRKQMHIASLYERSLENLDELINNPTQETSTTFFSEYNDALMAKNDMQSDGFINRDETISKVQDVERIDGDLELVQDMLRSYLKPNAYDIFEVSYLADLKAQGRKRELYNSSVRLKELVPKLIEETPELSEEEIEEAVVDTASEEEAREAVLKAAEAKVEENRRVDAIDEQVRTMFIAKGRGQEVEEYLLSNPIGKQTEKEVLSKVGAYLATINEDDVKKAEQGLLKTFTDKISGFGNWGMDGTLHFDENVFIYNNLNNEDKIKYLTALVDYYNGHLNIPGVSQSYKNVKKSLGRLESMKLKGLLSVVPEVKESFAKVVGEYVVSRTAGETMFSVMSGSDNLGSYPTEHDAEERIAEIQEQIEIANNVKATQVANIENKFNNGYWYPVVYDVNNNPVTRTDNSTALRTELYAKISDGMTEQQVGEDIAQHAVLERFSLEDNNHSVKMYGPKGDLMPNLRYEPILHSVTTDTLVLSYQMEDGSKIPLNSYKHPLKGLVFADEKYLVNQLMHPNPKLGIKPMGIVDAQMVTKFVSGLTYYEYLQKSEKDPFVFNLITSHRVINFKGTPQEQRIKLEELQATWNAMNNSNPEEFKTKFDFSRVFTGHDYYDTATLNITDLPYQYAQVAYGDSGVKYNQRVFFHIKDNFNNKTLDPSKIKFIGVPDDFHADARAQIIKSIASRHNGVDFATREKLIKQAERDVKTISETDRFSVIINTTGKNGLDTNIGITEYKKEAIKLVNERLQGALEGGRTIYGGYFMLVTDSSGSPGYYALTTPSIDAASFFDEYNRNGFINLAVIAHNDTTKIAYEEANKRFKIDDLTDNSFAYVTHEIKSIDDVREIHTAIVKSLKKQNKTWFKKQVDDKGDVIKEAEAAKITKVFPVDSLVTSLITKSQYAPTTQEEIVAHRKVSGVNPKQFKTKKVEVAMRTEARETGFVTPLPEPAIVALPISLPTEPIPVDSTVDRVSARDILKTIPSLTLPDFVNMEEIDTFVDSLEDTINPPENIKRVLLLAYAENLANTTGPFYLNNGLNAKMLDNFAKQPNTPAGNTAITNAVGGKLKGKLNLFTNRNPYDTENKTVKDRVAELIQNCIR